MKKKMPFFDRYSSNIFGVIAALGLINLFGGLVFFTPLVWMIILMAIYAFISIVPLRMSMQSKTYVYILEEFQKPTHNLTIDELKNEILELINRRQLPHNAQKNIDEICVGYALFKKDQLGEQSKIKMSDCPKFIGNKFLNVDYYTEL